MTVFLCYIFDKREDYRHHLPDFAFVCLLQQPEMTEAAGCSGAFVRLYCKLLYVRTQYLCTYAL